MALAVKHLNGDASFMLTFDALLPDQPPFRILIDPWITGKSKIFHSKISVTRHKEAACITSLAELPEPDLVIISQNKSDHCNEETLRQLPSKDTKTIILAEPAAARTIQGWKYFEKGKVRALPKWGDLKLTRKQMVRRIKIPSASPDQIDPGEVTVAFIPQRKDISGLHAAIGITYRPPHDVSPPPSRAEKSSSPPITPRSWKSCGDLRSNPLVLSRPSEVGTQINPYSSEPISPTHSTLRSVRSVASMATTLRDCGISTASLASLARPLSVIFSPHGIHYESLESYTTAHLIAEAALPLTALLHCFDSVTNPWWLGGNILLGAPAGIKTASKLSARAWISTHDAEKEVKGIATRLLRTRKWNDEDVLGALSAAELAWRQERETLRYKMLCSLQRSKAARKPAAKELTRSARATSTATSTATADKVRIDTDLIRLRVGEEVMLTNGPIVMIDRESLTTEVQETPAMLNIQPNLKTPSGPILRPPPRSAGRPAPPTPIAKPQIKRYGSSEGSGTTNTPPKPPTTAGSTLIPTSTPTSANAPATFSRAGDDVPISPIPTLTPATTPSSANAHAIFSQAGDDVPPLSPMPSLTPATTFETAFELISAFNLLGDEPRSFTERRYTNSIRTLEYNDNERPLSSLPAVLMMRQLDEETNWI